MKEILIYSALYLALFGFTDFLYHKLKVKVDYTRKLVHISTGIIALTFPIYLESIWEVAALCSSFLVLMFLSEKYRWFKSITAVERKSYGSWLFALIVLICFTLMNYSSPEYYFLPILVLTIGDPLAAFVGKKLNFIPLYFFGHKKTIGGSLTFFIACFLLIFFYDIFCNFYGFHSITRIDSIPNILVITLVATVAELVSTKGWDNLSIPLSVITMLFIFSYYS